MGWPRGEATDCKSVYTGSNPVPTSTAPLDNSRAWAIGAAVARFPDTEEVTGSNPVSPTKFSQIRVVSRPNRCLGCDLPVVEVRAKRASKPRHAGGNTAAIRSRILATSTAPRTRRGSCSVDAAPSRTEHHVRRQALSPKFDVSGVPEMARNAAARGSAYSSPHPPAISQPSALKGWREERSQTARVRPVVDGCHGSPFRSGTFGTARTPAASCLLTAHQ